MDRFIPFQAVYDLVFFPHDYRQTVREQIQQASHGISNRSTPIQGVLGMADASSLLAAVFAREHHLPGPTPQALVLAQYKHHFHRLAAGINPHQPPFIVLSPKTEPSFPFPYPVFIKPVKGITSTNAFLVHSQDELNDRKRYIRHHLSEEMRWYQDAFDFIMTNDHTPVSSYIVQPYLPYDQYTADGFMYKGRSYLLGITQSFYTPDGKSFSRFDFPATIAPAVRKNLERIVQALAAALDYDVYGFNMEFFIDPEGNSICIEWNTRLSNQFLGLLAQHYRMHPLQMMLELCLGRLPPLDHHPTFVPMSSFPLRLSHNARVTRVPTEQEIAAFRSWPDIVDISILVEEGKLLSDYRQDAYSYRYAIVDIRGETLAHRESTLKKILEVFPMTFEPV